MTPKEVIQYLITDRINDLSVRRATVNLTAGSLGNPQITVGVTPFYDWDKDKRPTFYICYGRYMNTEMLVYQKQLKDINPFITKDQKEAINKVQEIINSIN
jgi:hypothetical protein